MSLLAESCRLLGLLRLELAAVSGLFSCFFWKISPLLSFLGFSSFSSANSSDSLIVVWASGGFSLGFEELKDFWKVSKTFWSISTRVKENCRVFEDLASFLASCKDLSFIGFSCRQLLLRDLLSGFGFESI